MTGPVDVASSTVTALSRNPVLLALLVFILVALGLFAWVGANTREHYDNLYKALLDNQAKILDSCGGR
jgi:hypothetical protein